MEPEIAHHERNKIPSDERVLALAVLNQARVDLTAGKSHSDEVRDEAWAFVFGKTKAWLRSRSEWCNLAGIEGWQYEKACRAFFEQKSKGGVPDGRSQRAA